MPRQSRTAPALLASAALLAAPLSISAQPEPTLPVKRIMLYRSGVGYFERAGQVEGDSTVQLRFNTDQINDILKSLVLIDRGGGTVSSVSYGSKEPLDRRLGSFGVNIADNPSMAELLLQLRGAPARLSTADGPIEGTILGVEAREVASGTDASATRSQFLNLVTSTGLKSVQVDLIASFEILDGALAEELNRALAAVAEYRADSTKMVDLHFTGRGDREVVVGYVHETPVWKTSYRLVLPESDARGSDTVAMQGWAIVENTTDIDWEDVQLGLVSGRPVSFQMDLYQTLFTNRPEVPVPTIPGVAPRAYAAGANRALKSLAATPAPSARENSRARFAGRGGSSQYDAEDSMVNAELAYTPASDLSQGVEAQAQAGLVGEVFRYEVSQPVTIERQRSAMIPIINADIAGRRVSIYNPADARAHPMRGIELTNDTDLQLLPGPISVFDGPAYAGDAQINHVGAGDTRLLSYALDLDVGVIVRDDGTNQIQRLRIVDGLIEQTYKQRQRVTYAFENNDSKPRTLIVESPRINNWSLVEPARATEETDGLYRFEIDIDSEASSALTVTQERTYNQSIAVTSLDLPTAIQYRRNGKLSAEVLAAIRDVADRQSRMNEIQRSIQQTDRDVQAIHTEQNRIRSNMNTVNRSTDLYNRYMQKLTTQETLLEDLQEQRAERQRALEGMRNELTQFLRGLNIN